MTASTFPSLPEIEGVSVCYGTLAIDASGPTMEVVCLRGMADPHCGYSVSYIPVSMDTAHDLSWQGPSASIWLYMIDSYGIRHWQIGVLAFTEAEALDAVDAVRDAIGELR